MLPDEDLIAGFLRCRELGALAQVHAENGELIAYLQAKMLAEGVTSPRAMCSRVRRNAKAKRPAAPSPWRKSPMSRCTSCMYRRRKPREAIADARAAAA